MNRYRCLWKHAFPRLTTCAFRHRNARFQAGSIWLEADRLIAKGCQAYAGLLSDTDGHTSIPASHQIGVAPEPSGLQAAFRFSVNSRQPLPGATGPAGLVLAAIFKPLAEWPHRSAQCQNLYSGRFEPSPGGDHGLSLGRQPTPE